ncbi:MAG TPA: metalloregulator ArsR/SmtB family transcription factor [Elusimicrobiales bacterium]|nr:metalloregulator ArsR/SmtB family transcription factor [Elusimicrobiales bacterium]
MKQSVLEKAGQLSETLQCIAHPLRLLIVCMLIKREMFVGEIIGALGTTKGNISQHLRLLADRGLIAHRKEGNKVFYSLKDKNLALLIGNMKDLYCPGFKI